MSSTEVDEDIMMGRLRVGVHPEHMTTIAMGAYQMLIDAYDRKVPRDKFKEHVQIAMQIYDLTGRYCLANNVAEKIKHDDKPVSIEAIQEAKSTLHEMLTVAVETCIREADLLMQCPNDGIDPIS